MYYTWYDFPVAATCFELLWLWFRHKVSHIHVCPNAPLRISHFLSYTPTHFYAMHFVSPSPLEVHVWYLIVLVLLKVNIPKAQQTNAHDCLEGEIFEVVVVYFQRSVTSLYHPYICRFKWYHRVSSFLADGKFRALDTWSISSRWSSGNPAGQNLDVLSRICLF